MVRKVKDIIPEGEAEIYDIEVEGTHNFIANGIIVHNSMATPHISGLVALAIDRELLPQNVDKIKEILRKTASDQFIFGGEIMDGKSHEQGWGVFHWDRLRG